MWEGVNLRLQPERAVAGLANVAISQTRSRAFSRAHEKTEE